MRRAVCIAALWLAGCAADPVPQVTVREVSPLRIDPARADQDDVTLALRYEDADGDLGGGEALVQDCRAADVVSRFALPALAQPDAVAAGVAISGELVLRIGGVSDVAPAALPALCAAGGASPVAGAVIFCVTLRDLAGHRSPPACAAPVALGSGGS